MITEDVVEGMRRDIDVRLNGPQADATDFSISFAYTDADTTRQVVAKLAQRFIDESLVDREVFTAGFHQFLEAQAEEVRVRLADSDSKLREWAVKHPQHRPPQELVICCSPRRCGAGGASVAHQSRPESADNGGRGRARISPIVSRRRLRRSTRSGRLYPLGWTLATTNLVIVPCSCGCSPP
jgi:hypothetical protein